MAEKIQINPLGDQNGNKVQKVALKRQCGRKFRMIPPGYLS